VLGGRPAFDEIVELGIDRDAVVAGKQARRYLRILFDQARDERHNRVGGAGTAENDLIARPREPEGRAQ